MQIRFSKKPNILILGDFNVRSYSSLDLNKGNCRELVQFFNYLHLKQINTVFNCDDVLLDLVATNEKRCTVNRETIPFAVEDKFHPALSIEFPCNMYKPIPFPTFQNKRSYNFRKANTTALFNSIRMANWHKVSEYENVDEMVETFYNTLYEVLDPNVPTRRVNKRKYPIWYDAEIITTLKLKNKYHYKYKKHKRQIDLDSFKHFRLLSKSQIKLRFREFISNTEASIISQPQNLWSFINSKKSNSRIPGRMSYDGNVSDNPSSIVESFANYFSSVYTPPHNVNMEVNVNTNMPNVNIDMFSVSQVVKAIKSSMGCTSVGDDEIPYWIVDECAETFAIPLTCIINRSIALCEFPKAWKIARVVPIHKSGDRSDIKNYRPISVLSIFAKIFERLIFDSISVQIKQYISPYQHGFLPKRSTTTNLAIKSEFISTALDKGTQVDVIYTDFRKAFDTIDIGIIINKLRYIGMHNDAVRFFESYLRSREQYVFYNGVRSNTYEPSSGVPQGSNLGPLLFLIFINDLPKILSNNILMFADDVKLFKEIINIDDCLELQLDLNTLHNWCKKHHLELNIEKCKVMSYTRNRNYVKFPYLIGNCGINRVLSTTDLGVIFNTHLTFNEHLTDISNKAVKRLGFVIRNCRDFNNINVLKKAYIALVRPLLEYATVIWSPSTACGVSLIENVQRRFLKYMHLKTTGSYPPIGYPNQMLLNEFQMCSLETRRKYFDAVFVVNICNGRIDSSELLGKLNFRVPRSSSRISHPFYQDGNKKCVKSNSPIARACRTINVNSERVDLSSVGKDILRNIFLCAGQ